MDLLGKIRRWHYRDSVGMPEIAEKTSPVAHHAGLVGLTTCYDFPWHLHALYLSNKSPWGRGFEVCRE